MIVGLCACRAMSAQQNAIVYEAADVLPNVSIDGESAIIHTQGLFATDEHFLVTGRLEKEPKRALLLRFSRTDLRSYEFIDITPPPINGVTLDHPGGFDVDSQGRLWIPVSTSHPQGPSLICRYAIDPNQPLTQREPDFSYQVDDHIGAICRRKSDALVGANWDTKVIYEWSADGNLMRRIERAQLFGKAPAWQVAVQDWKFLARGTNQAILGGIDKSNQRSRALVQIVDFSQGEILESHQLEQREDVARPVTNEGLAVHRGKLFLLPEDIGRGAKVLRFRFSPIAD